MLNDIGKVESVPRPDIVRGTRDRDTQGKNKDQSPSANSQNTNEEEPEEGTTQSPHLLDIRI